MIETSLANAELRSNPRLLATANQKTKKVNWEQVLRDFYQAGKQDDRRDLPTRLKDHLWHFPKGKMKGFLKGLRQTLLTWIRPRSAFYQPNYQNFFQEIEGAEKNTLLFLQEFAQSDWETRGELIGEGTVTTGQWILKWIFALKGIRGGLVQVGKKW